MITASNTGIAGLSWWHIIRLGLIQTSLGGIVVLTTSTLNRIMVVELAMAATIPPREVCIRPSRMMCHQLSPAVPVLEAVIMRTSPRGQWRHSSSRARRVIRRSRCTKAPVA